MLLAARQKHTNAIAVRNAAAAAVSTPAAPGAATTSTFFDPLLRARQAEECGGPVLGLRERLRGARSMLTPGTSVRTRAGRGPAVPAGAVIGIVALVVEDLVRCHFAGLREGWSGG